MQKNQFLKVKNGLSELERDFIELKDSELKEREVKIKRKIEELFFKLIIVSIDNMDKFEEKEMKKIRPFMIDWLKCDWLISYIPKPITKTVGRFKDKVISPFKTNTPKQAVYEREKKLNKSKTQKQYEEKKL